MLRLSQLQIIPFFPVPQWMRAIYLREVTIANRKFHTLRGRFYQDLDNRLLLKRNFSSYSFFFLFPLFCRWTRYICLMVMDVYLLFVHGLSISRSRLYNYVKINGKSRCETMRSTVFVPREKKNTNFEWTTRMTVSLWTFTTFDAVLYTCNILDAPRALRTLSPYGEIVIDFWCTLRVSSCAAYVNGEHKVK